MHKKISTLLMVSIIITATTLNSAVFAQDRLCSEVGGAGDSAFCSGSNSGSGQGEIVGNGSILNTAIELLTTAAAVVAVFMIIVGGIMYVVSNGDASRVSRGRSTVIYAAVGLVVAIMARLILVFILDRINV